MEHAVEEKTAQHALLVIIAKIVAKMAAAAVFANNDI